MKSVRPTLEELMHSPDHYHGKASDQAESAVRHDDGKGINIKNLCPLHRCRMFHVSAQTNSLFIMSIPF